jgi:beta-mannosidase
VERNLKIFDNTRMFVRTTPDDGSVHLYPDMDPTWYNRSYKYEPWVSETGMHSIPEPNLFYELVDKKEFFDLGKMWDKSFEQTHPEFIQHFTEYGPGRVPRMLSRASHIDNMANPSIESISEASQVGAGEWYQIVSEKMQGNYPVTAGLMPWVFKRHWPVIAIQMMDWFGQPVAPYYFLKRTYEPTHIALDLPRLLWKSGEPIELNAKVTNATEAYPKAKATVLVYDDRFKQIAKEEKISDIPAGTSVTNILLNSYIIPSAYKNRFLFLVTELNDASGKLISRSVYYPRVLSMMDDSSFYNKYVSEPIPWVTLDKGPWLKPTAANSKTSLELKVISTQPLADGNTEIQLTIKNTGKIPAFMTTIDIEGAKRIFYARDNYFWLDSGEEKKLSMTLSFREDIVDKKIVLTAGAWNAKDVNIQLQNK